MQTVTRFRWTLFVVIAYLGSTILFTAPLPFHLADSMFDLGDSEITVAVMSWPSQFFFGHPRVQDRAFFNAPIFYPAAQSLLFTDPLVPYQIVFAPVFLLSRNPILAHNMVFLGCLFFSALAMYRLALYYTNDRAASFVGGFIFGFAPIHFSQPHHVQLQGLLWMPLCLLFLEKWWENRRARDLLLGAVCFALQMLTSFYLGSFFALMLFCWLAVRAFSEWSRVKNRLAQILVALVLAALLIGPYARGYREVQRSWGTARTEAENVQFSADLTKSWVGVHPSNFFYGRLFSGLNAGRPYEQFLFNGFGVLVLAFVSLKLVKRNLQPTWRKTISLHIGLFFTAFIFALGPRLQIAGHLTNIALPYKFLAEWVPGFDAFRVPARFGLVMLLPLSVLAAFGLMAIRRWNEIEAMQESTEPAGRGGTTRRKAVTALAAVFLGLEFLCVPMKVYRVDPILHIPPEYRFLQERNAVGALYPNSAVLEIPFTSPVRAHQTSEYTLMSIFHQRDLVNGESGFFPASYFEMAGVAERLPSLDALDALAALNVRTLVVHFDRLSASDQNLWTEARRNIPELVLLAKFESGAAVFENRRAPRVTRNAQHLEFELNAAEFRAGQPAHVQVQAKLKSVEAEAGQEFDVWCYPQWPRRVRGSGVTVTWRAGESGLAEVAREHQRIRLPLFIPSNEKRWIELSLRAPNRAGQYWLEISGKEFGFFRVPVRVMAR